MYGTNGVCSRPPHVRAACSSRARMRWGARPRRHAYSCCCSCCWRAPDSVQGCVLRTRRLRWVGSQIPRATHPNTTPYGCQPRLRRPDPRTAPLCMHVPGEQARPTAPTPTAKGWTEGRQRRVPCSATSPRGGRCRCTRASLQEEVPGWADGWVTEEVAPPFVEGCCCRSIHEAVPDASLSLGPRQVPAWEVEGSVASLALLGGLWCPLVYTLTQGLATREWPTS